jgi:hypothetical protein
MAGKICGATKIVPLFFYSTSGSAILVLLTPAISYDGIYPLLRTAQHHSLEIGECKDTAVYFTALRTKELDFFMLA